MKLEQGRKVEQELPNKVELREVNLSDHHKEAAVNWSTEAVE